MARACGTQDAPALVEYGDPQCPYCRQAESVVRELLEAFGDDGLDTEPFREALRRHAGAERIAADVPTTQVSGATGTPTFFVNGKRHEGAYNIDTLASVVRDAGARAR